MRKFVIALLATLFAGPLAAQQTIKVATIAPKGSIYHRALQEMGEAYRQKAPAGARFIIYPDSIQGTEGDTVRRMRVGQLDASMITVVGLSEIDPSVAALQYMPMMFRSWEEVDHVREKLRPDLEAKMRARGFVVLIWGEGGWVQFFTKDPIWTPEEYKKAKIFTWSGDKLQASVMKSLGYNPVSIPLADIAPALETGMVDAVPIAPLWSMIGQFDRVTKHMLRMNWVPIVGATVMRRETYDAMQPAARDALLAAARKAEIEMRAHRVKQDEEAIAAMKKRGLNVREMTPELEKAWRAVAESSYPMVRGTMVPAETFDRVRAILAEHRK